MLCHKTIVIISNKPKYMFVYFSCKGKLPQVLRQKMTLLVRSDSLKQRKQLCGVPDDKINE